MKKLWTCVLALVFVLSLGLLAACSDVKVEGVLLDKETAVMQVGDTLTLAATVSPEGATDKSVTWSTSKADVATVSDKGVVTAAGLGEATITVKTKDGEFTDTCAVTVVQKAAGITLDKSFANLQVGGTLTLNETVTPDSATDKTVVWSTNNASVATVSGTGVVTAVAYGEATVTAKTNDGNFTATCKISVYEKVIKTKAELESAIANQAAGQHWCIENGTYDLGRNETIELEGQKGWYFPIIEDNISIIGKGDVLVTSSIISKNQALASQNLVSVYGDNVSIDNVDFACKMEANKTILVQAKNFTLKNSAFVENTLVKESDYNAAVEEADRAYKAFNGSLYFYGDAENDVGEVLIENVTLNKSFISTTSVKKGTITLKNTTLDVCGNDMLKIDGFAATSANANQFIVADNFKIIADNKITNLQKKVIANAPAKTIVELKAGTYKLPEQIQIGKALTLRGEGEVILTTSDNAWTGIVGERGHAPIITVVDRNGDTNTVKDVVIENLTVKGAKKIDASGDNGHGINIVNAEVKISNVNIIENAAAGMVINSGKVELTNVSFDKNVWGGINVDGKKGAVDLKVNNCIFGKIDEGTPPAYNAQIIWADKDANEHVTVEGWTSAQSGTDGPYVWTEA